jgi:hypothetical protein
MIASKDELTIAAARPGGPEASGSITPTDLRCIGASPCDEPNGLLRRPRPTLVNLGNQLAR